MPKHDEQVPWGWPDYAKYLQHLWERYRITNVHFNAFWDAQNGRCVCNREFAHPLIRKMRMGYRPEIDHKHRKDAEGNELQCEAADVRGLLCARCNRFLGIIRDNQDILAGLLAYLKRHGETYE